MSITFISMPKSEKINRDICCYNLSTLSSFFCVCACVWPFLPKQTYISYAVAFTYQFIIRTVILFSFHWFIIFILSKSSLRLNDFVCVCVLCPFRKFMLSLTFFFVLPFWPLVSGFFVFLRMNTNGTQILNILKHVYLSFSSLCITTLCLACVCFINDFYTSHLSRLLLFFLLKSHQEEINIFV